MRCRLYICLAAALAALAGIASDEIQGSAADVLAAIREKAIGRVYAFDALISVPPTDAEPQFVVRDRTGSVVIRRDFDWPDETFRAGDRVMQTKNNYNRIWQDMETREIGAGLYNGDTGVIESVDSRGKVLQIRFDSKVSEYSFTELSELEHAFAITAHKSQGSEYRAVIIPVFDCPSRLLSRNLLYTAVTRAKELLVIVGREDMTRQMVVSGTPEKRYSALKKRIRNEY
jgi:ATP-dependent exoDNAse (exonuclease V) alpha subunit